MYEGTLEPNSHANALLIDGIEDQFLMLRDRTELTVEEERR
jgi:hypothetical protein